MTCRVAPLQIPVSPSNNCSKASVEGQQIFDKLLKACNEVEWRGNSILVLKEIRVDPPYTADSCSLIKKNGGLDAHSLGRVKKIVEAASK